MPLNRFRDRSEVTPVRPTRRPARPSRRLSFESLEDRTAPAVAAWEIDLTAGQAVGLRAAGADVELFLAADPASVVARRPAADVSSIALRGSAGDDAVTLDFSAGHFL